MAFDTESDDVRDQVTECIVLADECARVCAHHVQHCLELGGEHARPGHISLMLTCARICSLTSELLALDSSWSPTMCDLCEQVCEECADACRALGSMDDCVSACNECAAACGNLVAFEEANGELPPERSTEEALAL